MFGVVSVNFIEVSKRTVVVTNKRYIVGIETLFIQGEVSALRNGGIVGEVFPSEAITGVCDNKMLTE